MNKAKIVLAASWGVIALAVLVAAYFTWDAFSRKSAEFDGDEENEGLSTYVDKVVSLTGKKPFPSKANKDRLDENRKLVEDWRERARKAAEAGDWRADATCTPAQFKEVLVRDAKRIVSLPGSEAGTLMKPDFGFGPFKPYLGDTLPPKDQLAKLQRQWYDITSLIDVLVTNGVKQVTDLQVVERKADEAKSESKSKAKAKRKGGNETDKGPSIETYKLTFVASPEAFVNVVRQLSFQERFTTVDGFEFARERDVIVEAMGGEQKKQQGDAVAAGGRRGRRRGGRDAEPKEDDKAKEKRGAIVFDPETDSVFKVDLTVSVCDFRTLEDDNEKGEAK